MLWYAIWADGERYGPVDESEVRVWLDEHRVTPEMIVESEDGLKKITVGELLGLVADEPNPSEAGELSWPSLQEVETEPEELAISLPDPPSDNALITEQSAELSWPSLQEAETEPEEPVVNLADPPGDDVLITKQEYAQVFASRAKPQPVQASPEAHKAYVGALICTFAGLAVLCCPVMPFFGLICALRAKTLGHPKSQAALAVAIGGLVFSILFWIVIGNLPPSSR